MKRFIAGFISVILFLQLVGFSCFYLMQRYSFQKEAVQLIKSTDSNHFSVLTLSADAFKLAHFEENELLINGALYDVVAVTFHDEMVEVKVYHDVKEESFINNALHWFDSQKNNSSLPQLIFKTFFSPSYLTTIKQVTFYFSKFSMLFHHHDYCLLNIVLIPLLQPPNSDC